MTLLAVTVIGADRPGIVADVTGVLAGHAGNLEDSSMTLLRGQFAMMLLVATPEPAEQVEAALAPLAAGGRLLVAVREVTPGSAGEPVGGPHLLTVHGADRPGIVAGLTRVLADAGGNVTDLTTRLTGELYLLVAEVDLPASVDVAALTARLRDAAGRLGVVATLRPAAADVL